MKRNIKNSYFFQLASFAAIALGVGTPAFANGVLAGFGFHALFALLFQRANTEGLMCS